MEGKGIGVVIPGGSLWGAQGNPNQTPAANLGLRSRAVWEL